VEIDQTIVYDTLNRLGIHQARYYWVTSRDFNQNESFYSDSALVVIPDVFAPASARITEVQPGYSGLTLYFDRSPSEDVVTYILQRRIRSKNISDNEWQPIALEFDDTHFYNDTSIALYDTAEYRIMAMDEHGLTSLSNTRVGYLLEPVMLPGFEYLNAEFQDSLVEIYFDYSDKYQPVEFRLMGGDNELEMQTISLMEASNVI
jgi:hypothetical protein